MAIQSRNSSGDFPIISFKAFEIAYKNLTKKLLPQIYEIRFLKSLIACVTDWVLLLTFNRSGGCILLSFIQLLLYRDRCKIRNVLLMIEIAVDFVF